MEKISELLEDIGWAPQAETSNFEWKKATFKWMTEATNRIQELEHKLKLVEARSEYLENRANHHAKILEKLSE